MNALPNTLQALAPRRLGDLLLARCVRFLTEPSRSFHASEVSNLTSLKKRLLVGDVILISGNARISYVVKVLTLSAWSHVVLYVGDKRSLLTEEEKDEWSKRYGRDSLRHLVIDADPIRRVHLRPLDDYVGLMLRHCRAEALTEEDQDQVVDVALAQLGREYDVKHIIRLLFFFLFPWGILPESFRRLITDFTLSEDDRICSRVLSEAFESVGYPIRPLRISRGRSNFEKHALGVALGLKSRGRSAVRLLKGGRVGAALNRLVDERYTEIHLRGARHITPADYDLSRFFSVIKDDDDLEIRYTQAMKLCSIDDQELD